MSTRTTSLEAIEDFLAHKRIAIIGLSRDSKDFSAVLFKEMVERGYEVIPVNPNATEIQGRRCFAHVQEVVPPVEAALLMTTPEITDVVVAECAQAGIGHIWMYRAGGNGAVSNKAVEFCKQRGIAVIPGECPFMFLPHSGGFHRFHGFIRRITGCYPRRAA